MPWQHVPRRADYESAGDAMSVASCSSSIILQYLDVGCSTQSGNRYGSLNQDYCTVQEMYSQGEIPNEGKQLYIAAVCDGHGILGDKAAIFAGKAMVRSLYSGAFRNKKLSKVPLSELEAELKAVFKKGHQAACSVYDSPPKVVDYPKPSGAMLQYTLVDVSGVLVYRCNGKALEKMLECGCTATVAVVQGRKMCLANVGDSQAVLGSWEESTGEYNAEVVTQRHWGCLESEAARIQTQHHESTRLLTDGYVKIIDGPLTGYQLSVTRALGHKNLQDFGVISDPYVMARELDDHHCCLVLASDGVWDVMTPSEVVRHVMESAEAGKSAPQAAIALVQHAVDLGMGGPSAAQDNTSAAVIYL